LGAIELLPQIVSARQAMNPRDSGIHDETSSDS
jgi:hypothetical protein